MFKKEFEFYLRRAATFRDRVQEKIFSGFAGLDCEYGASQEPVKFEDRLKLEYKPLRQGERWGEDWSSAWLHITGTVPEEFADRETVLILNTGGEALIFDEDGIPVCGLTGYSLYSDNYTKELFFLKDKKSGDKVDLWVECAANTLRGLVFDWDKTFIRTQHPQGKFVGILRICGLGAFEREIWNLHRDLEVLISLMDGIGDFRRDRWCRIINKAADVYNENPAGAAKAREVLRPLFEIAPSGSMMTSHAVGHAHIDTAYLWPVRESIRKCARTFSSQLLLMEEYPDYIFGASAAQHYAFIKENYPGLYEKIKLAVKSGRWEVQGGMWVEADSNLIGGESMVRQFLYGKNFFMDEFGVDVKNLWLPDVFGYSGALPQIMKKSGCDYFLTVKLSWNQFNPFPHQTFRWQGIDGSEVLTHFPPSSTYNDALMPHDQIRVQNEYMQGDVLSDFMTLYGIGNGGGGPYPEVIERGLRQKNLDGCPHVKFDRADNFFETIAEQRSELPVWKGELYFEYHRGTFTSQSRTKRGNRKSEQLLAFTEFLCSLLPAEEYPAKELEKTWKTLLLNQFHDIIPGSSIHMVYEDAEKDYKQILDTCTGLVKTAAEKLFVRDPDSATVVNSLSCACTALAELPWDSCAVQDESGNLLPVQHEDGKTFVRVELPAHSSVCLKKAGTVTPENQTCKEDLVLENDLVRYVFNADAQLVEAYDKTASRSLLKPGMKGNELSLYVDNPVSYDAWEVDIYYKNQTPVHPEGIRARKTAEGPLRSVLEFELAISETSSMRQKIVLEAGKKRLDFHTDAEWHETHRMLRTAFPLDLFSSEAAFDIQYGFVKRSMNGNTSREMAQFEVCGHRYADISESGYGAALLNDCKYGHRVKESIIDLALLRSPVYPDHLADQGHHRFTYSLLPHEGDLVHSGVMAEAALLNRGPYVLDGMAGKVQFPVKLESDSLSLEAVKKAEKSDALVLRIVETKGIPGRGRLYLNGKRLVETDIPEWHDSPEYEVRSGTAEITLKPFEIKTFKIF